MRKADRLFDIIQILRAAKKPTTAAAIAVKLEVTARTVYRDIVALQASRIPIEGEAGIGYILRRGFDLPPLMFTLDEIEAIVVGTRLIRRTGDQVLQRAAERVLSKVTVILPEALREHADAAPVYVSARGVKAPPTIDFAEIRSAIRATRKLRIAYADEKGQSTLRTIWPIAVAYYVEATVIAAWCELRRDYRHFRADRISSAELLDESFPSGGGKLMADWLALTQSARA